MKRGSRTTVAGGELLERDRQIGAVDALLERARGGAGGAAVIEGRAGLGKSRLIDMAFELARADGMMVLAARGELLEMGLPWGVVRQLLAPALTRSGSRAAHRGAKPRAASGGDVPVLDGAAAAAIPLLDGTAQLAAEHSGSGLLPMAHALSWAVSNLAEAAPLLLAIDDAHWADHASLRLIAYLLGRLGDLPVAVLLARRPHEPTETRPLLETIALDSRVERIELAPLSEESVAALVRGALGASAAVGVIEECAAMTRGNPFYLWELLRELSDLPPEGLDPTAVRGVSPESIARRVALRLQGIGPEAAGFARAVAILGDGASFAHARELAGLGDEAAARSFDALAAVKILDTEEPLSFVHPLVEEAVRSAIGAGERGELHRRAARLLEQAGATPEELATHLRRAGRRGDPWVVATLRAAAARATAQGATEAAARWLSRALEEPPPAGERGALLLELGRAEAALGRPEAIERLEAAGDLLDDPRDYARVCLELGRAIGVQGRPAEGAAAFRRGLDRLRERDPERDSEIAKELRAGWWALASLDAGLRKEALRVPEPPLPPEGEPLTPGQRELLAQLAMQRSLQGGRPEEVAPLAERAWGDGELLKTSSSDGLTWSLVAGAMLAADEVEREIEVCDAALAEARRRTSPMAFAMASYTRAWPLLAEGRVNDAVADAQAALEARHDGWSGLLGSGTTIYVYALIERGALDTAQEALEMVRDDPELAASSQHGFLVAAAGRLLLAQGHAEQALETLLHAGELVEGVGMFCPSVLPWHADAAFAAALGGDSARAREIAAAALAGARRCGAPIAVARALRASARAERGERAIGLLREALDVLGDELPRLERIHALVELGAALRRARRRADARAVLTPALALARRGGALALAETARVELAAAGARTTEPLAGRASLTPSELRVAEMAAGGMTNRQIAQALFVTVKAVEYHLANTYRKLDLRGRGELARALGGGEREERPSAPVSGLG